MKIQLLAAAALLSFSACEPDRTVYLTAISHDGQLHFSNDSTVAIPHYGDTSWMIFYLVRHCEKESDGTKNPELSAKGKARAERLGKIFDDAVLHRICSTNKKRTMQTGQAVAAMTASPPQENFPPEAQRDWVADVLQENGGRNVLYVGHSNSVPELLNLLLGEDRFGEISETDFGRIYVAATQGIGRTEVLEFRYK